MLIKNLLLAVVVSAAIIVASNDAEEVLKTPRNNNGSVYASCAPVIDHKVFSTLGDFLLDLHDLHNLIDQSSTKKSKDRQRYEDQKNNLQEKIRYNFLKIKSVLEKVNAGVIFHPTPASKKVMEQHLSGISALSPEEFKRCSVEKYLNDISSPNTRLISTVYDNIEVDTGEWRNLSALLFSGPGKSCNFINALSGHAPYSPSGRCDMHHVYQTEQVITRLPSSLHSGYYAKLHPANRLLSSINRDIFNQERENMNVEWALTTASVAIANVLQKNIHLILSNADKLKELISLYSSSVEEKSEYCDSDDNSGSSNIFDADSPFPTSIQGGIFDNLYSIERSAQRSASLSVSEALTISPVNNSNNGLNITAAPYIPSPEFLFFLASKQSTMYLNDGY